MTNSLRTKLLLSYLAISLLTAGLTFALIRFTSSQRLTTLVLEQELTELEQEVQTWYEAEGSWDGFNQYFLALHPRPPRRPQQDNPEINSQQGDSEPDPAQQSQRGSSGNHGITDAENRLLNRYLNLEVGDTLSAALMTDAIPVIVDNETVAWIVPDDATGISLQAEEELFLENTNQVMLIASAISVSVSIVLAFWLANFLLQPITALKQASERMAQGELAQEIPFESPDELGDLAKSFTHMSQEVALANQRRRQLTADIAHDLSTPLHIASGYIDTMLDGDLTATPERLETVATELNHLRRLIEDLDLLALTDNKTLTLQLEPVALTAVIPHIVTSFQPLAVANDIHLEATALPPQLPHIMADKARLIQVLGNILNNALRFTPSGGEISVSVSHREQAVHVQIQDSGIGIEAKDLPFVFDRFYQGDKSRGQSGKMGLGLAISKGLIEAMQGSISVNSPGPAQGTTFSISLPY